jgi:thioester reductase-like protein
MRDSNYIGTQNVIEIATAAKVPFLYVSSIGVASTVGGKEVIPNPEIIPYKANGYIQTKWMNELYLNKLREFGYQIGILRPAFISGNSQSGCSNTDDFVWKFVRLLVNNSLSPIENKMILTPVDKVADAFVNALEKLPTVCNLIPINRADIAVICEIVAGKINGIVEKKTMEEIKAKLTELAQCGNKEVMTLLPSLQMTANVPFEMNYVTENNVDLSETNESLEHSVDYLLRVGFFGEQFADGKTKGVSRAAH